MLKGVKPYLFPLFGVCIGAIVGFVYWQQIGCNNGSCLITGVWYTSTLYGALLGGLGAIYIKDLIFGT